MGLCVRKAAIAHPPTARERTIPSRRHMSFPWNCSSSWQPFEDRFTAESVLAHTVSCPRTQLLLNYLRQAVERQKVERE